MSRAWVPRRLFAAALALGAVAAFTAPPGDARAEERPLIFGTDTPEGTLNGRWFRKIFAELSRRLGVPITLEVYPTKRVTVMLDAGRLDGEVVRAKAYAAAHPQLVRVEEPLFDVRFEIYATRPELKLASIDELGRTGWSASYRRGVLLCEQTLKAALPPDRVSEFTMTTQGVKGLAAGRVDVVCEIDRMVTEVVESPELRGLPKPRALLTFAGPAALHPYVHVRHRALAPRMAEVVRAMKAEGLIEKYLAEARDEVRGRSASPTGG